MPIRSYPFSNSRGVPIPLETAQPLSSFYITSDTPLLANVFVTGETYIAYAILDCRIYVGDLVAPNLAEQGLPNSAYLAGGTITSLVAGGANMQIAALGPDPAVVYVTKVEAWKALANVTTLGNG